MKARKPIAPAAPAQPSPWGQHLARLKLQRKKDRVADRARRVVTRLRLETTETILAAIIDGGDVLREISIPHTWHEEPGVALLVVLSQYRFRQLCEIGAEIEDGGEEEREGPEIPEGDDEYSLGSIDAEIDQTCWSRGWGDAEGPDADAEPSLGSCDGIVSQERWHEGYHHGDNERDDSLSDLDEADDEPSLLGVAGSSAEHARPDDQGRSDMEDEI